jgi:hypothetical protein
MRRASRFDDVDDAGLYPHFDDVIDETVHDESKEYLEYMKDLEDEENAMKEWEYNNSLRGSLSLHRECQNRRGAFLVRVADEDGDYSNPIVYADLEEDDE